MGAVKLELCGDWLYRKSLVAEFLRHGMQS